MAINNAKLNKKITMLNLLLNADLNVASAIAHVEVIIVALYRSA